MKIETRSEEYALCNWEGKILYVSDDLIARIPRSLEGVNLSEFLHPVDLARFDAFCLSQEPCITLPVAGIRGLRAVLLEKKGSGIGRLVRCTFAAREADLQAEARVLNPEFLHQVEAEFDRSRKQAMTLLESAPTDRSAMGRCFEDLYRSSMLLLIGSEMFFSHTKPKYLQPLSAFLQIVTDTVRESVRRFGSELTLFGEMDIVACYEDSSFAVMCMALLSVLNDVSVSHSVTVEMVSVSDGAAVKMGTACPKELSIPPRRLGQNLFLLPDSFHMRLYLCEIVGGAQGYPLQCAAEKGELCFTVELPDTRRGGEYLKNRFVPRDTDGLCRHYAKILFPENSLTVGEE